MTGLDVSGQKIAPGQLESELEAGGVPVPNGLVINGPPQPQPVPYGTLPTCPEGTLLYTLDDEGNPLDLPPGAAPIVAAHTPTVGV